MLLESGSGRLLSRGTGCQKVVMRRVNTKDRNKDLSYSYEWPCLLASSCGIECELAEQLRCDIVDEHMNHTTQVNRSFRAPPQSREQISPENAILLPQLQIQLLPENERHAQGNQR